MLGLSRVNGTKVRLPHRLWCKYGAYYVSMGQSGVKRNIIFPKPMDDRIRRVCEDTGRTITEIVRDAVDRWLDEYDARRKGAARESHPK